MTNSTYSPLERYQHDLESGLFSPDPAQAEAVRLLEDLYQRLVRAHSGQSNSLWKNLSRKLFAAPSEPERGYYFWGGVGRGKTYLMDMFHEALPIEKKLRVHFHRFMRRVHIELQSLQGEKNPLEKVADRISDQAVIICFDEFFVSDITDAMILAGLFDALFARGVSLVATSNIDPDNLYRDGLQRQRFLPAIELIKKHTEVVNIDGDVDYRLRTLEKAQLYYSPIDCDTVNALEEAFCQLSPMAREGLDEVKMDVPLEIEGREIVARRVADDVAWFEFKELCEGPRSQNDYIELAREFHTVIISNVPAMGVSNEDVARRFILLVDEFYDHRIKLVLSAEAALPNLYSGGRQSFEFQRTFSRLQEMQSQEYLGEAHRS